MVDIYMTIGIMLAFFVGNYINARSASEREKMLIDHCHEVDKKLIDLCTFNANCIAKNKIDLIKLEDKVKELECIIKENSTIS